ncbi:alcohol dehydrogenase [Mycolicibacterium conceptionense]|uniref:Alcohol dehydrogenase n=1 Tax=Mycolicibacterium conceptionense TaxID=451644 RepID=A0A0U1DKK8_9MYCO|nr:NADP-dependent oxidoreductase [Mycolicibacterium conceptionense]ORV24659.1 NADPH:quinone reductase [Mycolicibacterium conceptionense]CQD16662.1 alcohol dehydrogenase [Mycolicibacterium conceptionense]
MRAIEYRSFGGPEVLALVDVPIPQPGPGQALIAVRVAGVNGIDCKLRQGLFGEQNLPQRPGLELAGVVHAVGPGAAVTVGEEVFGWSAAGPLHLEGWPDGFPAGAYADYALADIVIPKPGALQWEEAVALPVAGETAIRGIRRLDIQRGETVLILGGSGVVGSIAVQLAVARGATVIASASRSNADYVASLGATPVLYGDGLAERVRTVTRGVDAALDAAGRGGLADVIELRGGADRVITIADPHAMEFGVTFDEGGPAGHNTDVLAELADQALSGAVRVRQSSRFALTNARQAQELSASGHASGKITLTVSDDPKRG